MAVDVPPGLLPGDVASIVEDASVGAASDVPVTRN